METILVGTDTSGAADLAVETAADLARGREAELVVLYVRPQAGAVHAMDPDKAADPGAYLAAMPARFPGVRVRTREETGDPALRITEVALDERAAIIVVGNRGLHGRPARTVRSVPGSVLRNARGSVLVVDTRARQ
jgi:nucleotide-binding universal stress UspA family protein